MQKLNHKGFTLAELLIAITIIGIIAAVAIPSASAMMRNARGQRCRANQNILQGQIQAFRTARLPGIDNLNLKWTAGSYDPETQTWKQYAYYRGDKDIRQYIYYGYDSSNKYREFTYECETAGECFLRYAYSYGNAPKNEVVFPTTGDGCQLYITFVETAQDARYDKKIEDALADLETKLKNRYGDEWQSRYAQEADIIYKKYNGVNGEDIYPDDDITIRSKQKKQDIEDAKYIPSGHVEIHCTCIEHESDKPLMVAY